MAATASIRGRFAARAAKSWDSFTDNRTGEIVAAGRSLSLFVVTEGDDQLETVKVPAALVESAHAATDGWKFGDEVELGVAVDRYGLKFVRVMAPKPVAAARTA